MTGDVPDDVTHDDELSVIEVLAIMLAIVQLAPTTVASAFMPTPTPAKFATPVMVALPEVRVPFCTRVTG